MKVHAIGLARNKGISKKNNPQGSEYDNCSLLILTPIEEGAGNSKEGGTWERSGYGYSVSEIPVQVDAMPQFKDVKFPAVLEVVTDAEPRFGRLVTVVTGLSVSSAPVSRAA